ncbi:hypothetical protein QYF36_021916 [Acer negundo]|nr:hypothetical protein QYF36_021916 [Acer negundo]
MLFEAFFTKKYGIAISLVVVHWLAFPKLFLRGLSMHVPQFGSLIIASLSLVGLAGNTLVGVVLEVSRGQCANMKSLERWARVPLIKCRGLTTTGLERQRLLMLQLIKCRSLLSSALERQRLSRGATVEVPRSEESWHLSDRDTFSLPRFYCRCSTAAVGGQEMPAVEARHYVSWKDRATRKTTYTPENLTADVEEDDNFDNEFEMPGNFSPMSVNLTDSNWSMHPTSSQPFSKKRSRSRDPIVRSMDRFANVMKGAIEKSNDTLDKFCQV